MPFFRDASPHPKHPTQALLRDLPVWDPLVRAAFTAAASKRVMLQEPQPEYLKGPGITVCLFFGLGFPV